MVRHIVLWNYAEGFSDTENLENAKKMKAELENLKSLIDGVVEIQVHIDAIASGNRAIMLDSLFESRAALEAYATHPEHVRVGQFVRAVTRDRACFDYEVD